MNHMSSILLSGPAVEPVSLAEAKAHLRVEHADADAEISALITTARTHLELRTRRAFITQTWRLVRDGWPAEGRIAVLPAPLRALIAARIIMRDGSQRLIDLDRFAIDKAGAPAMLAFVPATMPASDLPAAGIELDVEVGYGAAPADVPQPLRQAVRMLVAHWYENRGAIGDHSAMLPLSVNALIAPFRVLGL
jgi:uncharacterized phiE125 gp8 family phage protein